MSTILSFVVIIIILSPSIIAAALTLFLGKSKRGKYIIIICNTLFFTYILRKFTILAPLARCQDPNEMITTYVFIIGIIMALLISLSLSILGVSLVVLLKSCYKKIIAIFEKNSPRINHGIAPTKPEETNSSCPKTKPEELKDKD